MQYSVKEVAELTGVTIKTLHHYHKIGLLKPLRITDTGYRMYGGSELERLQQILFYRELDFSLKDIKKALEDEPSRLQCLEEQYQLLNARRQRTDRLLDTLEESIHFTRKGENMDNKAMFQGLNKEEWKGALKEQNEYLKDKYEFDMLQNNEINVELLNEQAAEAQRFTGFVADALKNGWKADDKRLQEAIQKHINFLNKHGINMDKRSFVDSARFNMEDDFHRSMLEGQQLGLSYYLHTAAQMYSAQ